MKRTSTSSRLLALAGARTPSPTPSPSPPSTPPRRAPRRSQLDLQRFEEHIEQSLTRFDDEKKLIKDTEVQYSLIHADETDETDTSSSP
jgi:hypothetical protein